MKALLILILLQVEAARTLGLREETIADGLRLAGHDIETPDLAGAFASLREKGLILETEGRWIISPLLAGLSEILPTREARAALLGTFIKAPSVGRAILAELRTPGTRAA